MAVGKQLCLLLMFLLLFDFIYNLKVTCLFGCFNFTYYLTLLFAESKDFGNIQNCNRTFSQCCRVLSVFSERNDSSNAIFLFFTLSEHFACVITVVFSQNCCKAMADL